MTKPHPDDAFAMQGWEKARTLEQSCCCGADPAHAHADAPCPRGSECRCARPIGHPVPFTMPHPRDAQD
jgi:hypothetical protein